MSNCKVGIPLPDWDPQGSRHEALMMPVLRSGALVLECLPQEVFANGRCQDSPGTEFEISSKISLSPEAKTPEGPHLEAGLGEPIYLVNGHKDRRTAPTMTLFKLRVRWNAALQGVAGHLAPSHRDMS